ncbi:hypothetical protein ACX80O_02245 [Arthrobacter sp. Hz1]
MPGPADESPPISLPFNVYLGAKDLDINPAMGLKAFEDAHAKSAVEIARRNHRLTECTDNLKWLLHSVSTLRSLDRTGQTVAAAEHLDYVWAITQGQLSALTQDVRRAADRYRQKVAAASTAEQEAEPTPGSLGIESVVKTNTRGGAVATPSVMAGRGNRK